MISLLMVAATLNAMAITYTGKVQVVLRATSNNAACAAVVATSDALNDGLNPSYYAELNDEGKEVLVYVEYNSVRYEHFGSSATTMRNMPLIMKANASGEYRMNFYEMVGTIEIYDKVAGANIDKSQPYIFTIEDAQKNTIIADRFIINYTPYEVTTNAYGLATFSAPEAVQIPSGLTGWIATGIAGEYLSLLEINAEQQVPANTGVILYGAANTDYQLPIIPSAADISGTNLLYAATVWPAAQGIVYILHGSELWEYTGSDFPANKAYLQLPGSNNAPKRISLRFGQATALDNIEAGAPAEKFMENGQIFIRRGNEVFNLQGQIVK